MSTCILATALYTRAKARSHHVAEQVKSNPTPYYLGAGTMALFALSILVLMRRHQPRSDFVQVRPDYLEEHSSLFDEVA